MSQRCSSNSNFSKLRELANSTDASRERWNVWAAKIRTIKTIKKTIPSSLTDHYLKLFKSNLIHPEHGKFTTIRWRNRIRTTLEYDWSRWARVIRMSNLKGTSAAPRTLCKCNTPDPCKQIAACPLNNLQFKKISTISPLSKMTRLPMPWLTNQSSHVWSKLQVVRRRLASINSLRTRFMTKTISYRVWAVWSPLATSLLQFK